MSHNVPGEALTELEQMMDAIHDKLAALMKQPRCLTMLPRPPGLLMLPMLLRPPRLPMSLKRGKGRRVSGR